MGLSAPAPLGRRRRRGGAFRVPQLFANGEAGAWYDPSDLTAEKVAWRRNLLTWSEDFTNAAWTKTRSSITPNAGTSWDGTATASKLVEDSSTGTHFIRQDISVTAGIPYAVTMYAKAAERSVLFISPDGGSNFFWFDLSNGTTGGSASGSSAIESVGSGWYRCIYLRTYTTTTTAALFFYVSNSTAGVSYTGDGTSGILVDSAQAQQSATATAYQRITDFTSDFLAAFPTHALYQDSAGTTPVTALGQPVGLVIDSKTGGLANLGPELVTNGDFSSGTTGWTAQTGSIAVVGGALRVFNTGTFARATQAITTVIGRTYYVSVAMRMVAGAGVLLRVTNSSDGSSTGQLATTSTTTSADFIRATCAFTATQTTTYVALLATFSVDPDGYFDNISVREVPGVHAIQPTSASRPLLDGRVNLLVSTEDFTSASWTLNNPGTRTANTDVAPDGTTTADTITDNITGNYTSVRQTITIPNGTQSYVCSAHFKKTTSATSFPGASMILSGGTAKAASVAINTDTGIAVARTGEVPDSIEVRDAGAYWRLLWTISNNGTGNTSIQSDIYAAVNTNGSATWAATTQGSAVIWGADLRLAADAAYPYQRVAAATDYADVGVPRSFLFDGFDDSLYTASNMDFATVTSDGLARRNLLSNPTQFDDAYWTKFQTTITANAAVAPDGTTTADKMVANTTSAQHSWSRSNAASAGTYTATVYAKAAEYNTIQLYLFTTGFVGQATARLDLGTVSIAGSGSPTGSIENVGNGWYRVILTATAAATVECGCYIGNNGSVSAFAGDNTSGLLFWGAQLETGSTATAFQNIGTDKVTVLAGVRKFVDAFSVVAETSADATSNNGAFIMCPGVVNIASFGSRGSATYRQADSASGAWGSPGTIMLTGIANISAPQSSVRVNGVQSNNVLSQGTGNYGSYVLFIGRRNNASAPFNGKAYQLIVRGALTDAATLVQAERFVAQRTGITL